MTRRIDEAGKDWDLTWNYENMLTEATSDQGDEVSLMYNADGVLVSRTEDGNTTRILNRIFTHDLTLDAKTKEFLFNGLRVAQRVDTSNRFFLSDHLGSTTTTVRANKTIEANLRYDPWGQERWSENITPTGYRYTNQRWDEGLGLYDYNARYYDAVIGRFVSADTLVPASSRREKRLAPLTVDFHETPMNQRLHQENQISGFFGPIDSRWPKEIKQEYGDSTGPFSPQLLNRFSFVGNSPIAYFDPSGHQLLRYEVPELNFWVEWNRVNDEGWWVLTIYFEDTINYIWVHESDPLWQEIDDSVADLKDAINEYNFAANSFKDARRQLFIGFIVAIVFAIITLIGLALTIPSGGLAFAVALASAIGAIIALLLVVWQMISVYDDWDLVWHEYYDALEVFEEFLGTIRSINEGCLTGTVCRIGS